MEGAIPSISMTLGNILEILAKMEAPEPQQTKSQGTHTEALNTLRGDLNIILEEK